MPIAENVLNKQGKNLLLLQLVCKDPKFIYVRAFDNRRLWGTKM